MSIYLGEHILWLCEEFAREIVHMVETNAERVDEILLGFIYHVVERNRNFCSFLICGQTIQ